MVCPASLDRRGLGDLEDQPAAGAAAVAGGRGEDARATRSSPIDSGDMLTESRSAGVGRQRLQRVRERQPVDRAPERAALDRRQEAAGRQQLARGVRQPGQHLEERRRPRVPRLHDRLVVEADAPLRQRLRDAEPQPRLRLEPARRRRLAGRRDFEELEGVDRGKLVHGSRPFRLACGWALPNADVSLNVREATKVFGAESGGDALRPLSPRPDVGPPPLRAATRASRTVTALATPPLRRAATGRARCLRTRLKQRLNAASDR